MKHLFLIAFVVLLNQHCFSQPLTKAGIDRIGDYSKLWSVINLFHPQLAYSQIDADSLFVNNIDELIKDPSAANFKTAVQKMIDGLHDPYTTIDGHDKSENDTIRFADRPLLRWVADSVAVLHFDDQFIEYNSNTAIVPTALLNLFDSVKNAHGIIIDLRKKMIDYDLYYNEQGFIKQLISYTADRFLLYPGSRTRIHYGHESQTSPVSYYYQGWVTLNGAVVKPKKQAIKKKICLLINKYDNSMNDGIVALQKQHIAKVIADGNLGNFESNTSYTMELTDSIKVNIHLNETIYPDESDSFSPDQTMLNHNQVTDDTIIQASLHLLHADWNEKTATKTTYKKLPVSSMVKGYDSLHYPPPALRLLGLARYWSYISYFCPNKDRTTKNWDSVLYEYVPRFLQAKDSFAYTIAVAGLIKELNDSHGFFSSPVFNPLQANIPPVKLKFIENKTIVYKIFSDSLKQDLFPGDEITAVGNIPIKKLRDSVAQYIGASDDASLQRDISMASLAGKKNSTFDLHYMHNGTAKTLQLKRTEPKYKYFNDETTGAVWRKIDNQTGYVDLGRLEVAQIDSMFNDFKATDCLIIDDRSYPKGTAWTLVNYLTGKKYISPAKGATVIADSPDPSVVTLQEQLWQIPVTPKPTYKGKIIILVNEITQSQAEYTCMVIQAAFKQVTIIGSQTAGADGDVTGIVLPGGIRTAFSGHGIHYPDGRPTQGTGIIPDIRIKPTIRGIRAGKDEVLDRAVQFAKTGK